MCWRINMPLGGGNGAGMDKELYFREKGRLFGADEPERIAGYCRERWPRETAHVLECADNACRNRFVFDFPWDMERTWEPYDFGEEIDWSLIPFGDREFLWQFNRHRFFLCLGQAYVLTGEERYAECFVRLLKDWCQKCGDWEDGGPGTEGDTGAAAGTGNGGNIDLGPWRTLETGIRAENWIRALFYVKDSPAVDGAFLEFFLERLSRHGERLTQCFAPHKYQSNWGALESAGLLLIALALPEGRRQQAFLRTALERLDVTAALQVMGDGTGWEQSPMYHNEVYRSFLTAVWYGRRAGVELPYRVEDAARRMAFADLAWMKPDRTQFAQGDSDATDLRDQLTAGAYLLKEPALKFGGYSHLDFDSVWLFGAQACLEYEKLPAREPEFTSIALSDSGNYYFRSGWEETAELLHFHCGDMGAAHGHADKMHIDLVLNGEDVLVDSGRYTYVESAQRYALKGARGHNITLVDGVEFTQIRDSWTCGRLSTAVKRQFREGRLAVFAEGAHLGYLEQGVFVNRKALWIRPDVYVIVDEFYPAGERPGGQEPRERAYEALFHFAAAGTAALRDGMAVYEGKGCEAFFQFMGGETHLSLQDTVQSTHYNRLEPNRTLTVSMRQKGFCSLTTVINGGARGGCAPAAVRRLVPRSAADGRAFARQEAEAFSISASGREFVVFIAHRELFSPADAAVIGGCMGYGSVIVFDMADGGKGVVTGETLSW